MMLTRCLRCCRIVSCMFSPVVSHRVLTSYAAHTLAGRTEYRLMGRSCG
ncbi:Putative secreted protein (plasmid) [Corynebacterium glyciniphilum AJ 3170]|uniref:Putative secreted protein n=1 Tax=Corynebacterium glyciniphilum AJ 3170 TaxID=1404245 RepID=X5DYI8_9CORY|nr:Putative secreted protein [Corynebacterium glyciniphilum AJ 3170]